MSFVSLGNQVALFQPRPVLGQGATPGWNPSGSPAFFQPSQVYQTQDTPTTPATPPATPAPAPVPVATAVPTSPAPAPAAMSGVSMLAIGIGVGAFVLGTVLAVTAGR